MASVERSAPKGRVLPLLPGLVVAAGAAVVAMLAAHAVDALSPLLLALVGGVVAGNLGMARERLRPGLAFSARTVLRVGVVLVGFRLVIGDLAALGPTGVVAILAVVTLTFLGVRALASVVGLSPSTGLLAGAGFAICGLTAVAAMRGLVEADDDEVGIAVGMVTLCGTLSIVALPLLQGLLGLDNLAYGRWVGLSVHDVGQVIAAASVAGEEALSAAVVTKLGRVALLGPLLVGVGLAMRSRREGGRRPGLVPPFVVAFVAATLIRSTGVLPEGVLAVAGIGETVALAMALFSLGAGIRLAALRPRGRRSLATAMTAWVSLGAVALAVVVLALG